MNVTVNNKPHDGKKFITVHRDGCGQINSVVGKRTDVTPDTVDEFQTNLDTVDQEDYTTSQVYLFSVPDKEAVSLIKSLRRKLRYQDDRWEAVDGECCGGYGEFGTWQLKQSAG